jgi:hypothetical protein
VGEDCGLLIDRSHCGARLVELAKNLPFEVLEEGVHWEVISLEEQYYETNLGGSGDGGAAAGHWMLLAATHCSKPWSEKIEVLQETGANNESRKEVPFFLSCQELGRRRKSKAVV